VQRQVRSSCLSSDVCWDLPGKRRRSAVSGGPSASCRAPALHLEGRRAQARSDARRMTTVAVFRRLPSACLSSSLCVWDVCPHRSDRSMGELGSWRRAGSLGRQTDEAGWRVGVRGDAREGSRGGKRGCGTLRHRGHDRGGQQERGLQGHLGARGDGEATAAVRTGGKVVRGGTRPAASHLATRPVRAFTAHCALRTAHRLATAGRGCGAVTSRGLALGRAAAVACRVAPTELAGVAAPGSSLREGGVRQREEQHDDLRYSDVSAADWHRLRRAGPAPALLAARSLIGRPRARWPGSQKHRCLDADASGC
jgi:hypothetical protein